MQFWFNFKSVLVQLGKFGSNTAHDKQTSPLGMTFAIPIFWARSHSQMSSKIPGYNLKSEFPFKREAPLAIALEVQRDRRAIARKTMDKYNVSVSPNKNSHYVNLIEVQ